MSFYSTFFISVHEFSLRTGLKETEVRKLIFQKNFPQFRIEQGRFYIDAFNALSYIESFDKEHFTAFIPSFREQEKLLSLPHFCKQSGISAKKMTVLLRRSDFPKLKIGARYYFHLPSAYRWFLDQLGTIICCDE